MAAPFCTACGAAVADGTRFCVKCGQPVGQAAPLAATQATVYTPPVIAPPPVSAPPPPPPPVQQAPVWTPPPPPPPVAQPFVPQPIAPQPMPVKEGPGAGLWIGIFGILLLLGGAGLWFYTTRMAGAHPGSTVQVAAAPTPEPSPVQAAPTPTPGGSTFVPAPTPNPTTEVIPPNPDQKDSSEPFAKPREQTRPQTVPTRPPAPAVQTNPPPAQPVKTAARQTSGVLHANVEVAQNGEVVFENLPGARLKFTFDHSLWQPTISHQANGTQTLVMRSLKQGIQTTCDVRWEIVQ
jgi:zinc-ribbon domain